MKRINVLFVAALLLASCDSFNVVDQPPVETAGKKIVASAVPVGSRTFTAEEPDSRGEAINNNGQLLGWTSNNHGALWNRGLYTDLGSMGAYDINNRGSAVGYVPGTQPNQKAAIWWKGQFTYLSEYNSRAEGINSRGQVAGQENQRAVIFEDGNATILADPFSVAMDINDSGVAVGYLGISPRNAVKWEDGQQTILYDGDSEAHGINNEGQIVGVALVDGTFKAVMWVGDALVVLGGPNSAAFAINNAGQVVGHEGHKAMMWADGQAIVLEEAHSQAKGINNRGQVAGFVDVDETNVYSYRAAIWEVH